MKRLAVQYRDELLDGVMPFWLEHSQDREWGGYFSCLARDGSVYDTDKFMWLQGRQMWMLAMLYNRVEKHPEWLQAAVHGAEFVKKHGHDGDWDWYFSLTREGRPLVQPYNIFSHAFVAMGFAQLAIATGNDEYAHIARKTFDKILQRSANPKGQWDKAYPGTREMRGFSLPMILCNLSLEIEPLVDGELIDRTIEECLHEVMEVFYRPELGLIVENVTMDGRLSDTFEGRLVNPGHGLEAMWFVMDLGQRLGRRDVTQQAVRRAIDIAKYGWDNEHGGLFYFMDRLGAPLQQLEWDQKLWWVHIEATIAMLKGYMLTGSGEALEWFERLHEYTWSHFKDTEYPEWFGYLTRQGTPLLTLKGGKWKGCFHIPRGLYQCWKALERINDGSDGTE